MGKQTIDRISLPTPLALPPGTNIQHLRLIQLTLLFPYQSFEQSESGTWYGLPSRSIFCLHAKDSTFLPSLPELDLPFPYGIPGNVHHCGSVLLPSIPVSESDPELLERLKRGPTVLISLGTIYEGSTKQVTEIAGGVRILLEKKKEIQVLWKSRPRRGREGRDDVLLDEILGRVVKEGRVRIREWSEAGPVVILQSGCVVSFVNHGGADSFFEGLGVSLVLFLPQCSNVEI
jgi:hypothetical protein